MAQLVPCPQCERHVRLSTASCPFCDVALDVSGLSEQYAARRVTAQPGLKRAAMFALGASVVAACSSQPVYGASVSPTSDETSTVTSDAPTTSESDTTSTPVLDTDAGQVHTDATTIDPTATNPDAGAAEDAGNDDAGADKDAGGSSFDGGAVDTTSADAALPDHTSGVIAQPPYGAPFPLSDDTSDGMAQPVYGAPPLNE